MASHLPFVIRTHKQKVLSCYKRALRNLESWYGFGRLDYRYHAVLMRQRFEKDRHIQGEKEKALWLANFEEELFKTQHWQPRQFAKSLGGNAYGRYAHVPDWVLDYWHPLEKAQYPEYFARREKRKEEYIRNWVKEYGPLEEKHH